MSSHIQLTNPVVQAILIALTHAIRLITLPQAQRTWWEHATISAVRAKFTALVDADYLIARRYLIRPERFCGEPIIAWRPGDPVPAFGAASYLLRKRCKEPVSPTLAYLATKKTAKLFGGFSGGSKGDGVLRHPLQASHDAAVSTRYLELLKSEPDTARRWVSEEKFEIQNRGSKLFDAVIVDDSGELERVIEVGGEYGVRRLKTIHAECARRLLPYELW